MSGEARTKAIAVVGAQWGDEGKGKVVDYLAASFDYTARYAGGHNAGHTVIFNGHRFVLQLIPCGILRPGKKAVIGTGTVVDPAALVAELDNLKKAGIDVRGRLFLSNRAHLIFPYHREMEKAAEAARGAAKIGTTSRGIGPAYEDKMARRGFRVCDLLDTDAFRGEARARDRREKCVQPRALRPSAGYGGTFRAVSGAGSADSRTGDRHVRAAESTRWTRGKPVLFEGAQGTMLDIDHGTYPYVTSSNATSGGACTGLGRGAHADHRRGRRDQGLYDARRQRAVSHGDARPRCARGARPRKRIRRGHGTPAAMRLARSGGAALREMLNGIDSLVVTKLDVFDTADAKFSLHRLSLQGRAAQRNAAGCGDALAESSRNTRRCRAGRSRRREFARCKNLPSAARDYLKFISDQLEVEIGMISTGPERDATIVPPGTKLASWL